MNKLSKYDGTEVRIVCKSGDCFSGPCEWYPKEFTRDEYGVEQEALRIGEYVIYEDNILSVELIREEVCVPVRDWPEAKEEIALWFHKRWGVPLEAYKESIYDCLGNETGVPQWYVVVRGGRIIAGCGVIENDFHERKDLAPNVCAVYVDEEFRCRGIAGYMLGFVCEDMKKLGYDTLYLVTDHIGFYERYGWEYLCPVKGSDDELSRMYVHRMAEE